MLTMICLLSLRIIPTIRASIDSGERMLTNLKLIKTFVDVA